MKSLFSFTLYNSPFEDTVLYARRLNSKEDLLFDLGDISNAPTAHLIRVKRIFISHTHIDHFCGFHDFFRTVLKLSGKEIEIYGPPKIIDNVYGALTSYTWNLIDEFDITFIVTEISEDRVKKARLSADNVFEPVVFEDIPLNTRTIVDDTFYSVTVDFFDHKTLVIGYRLDEKDRYAVNKKVLDEYGLEPGNWIVESKASLLKGEPINTVVSNDKGDIAIDPIKDRLFILKEKFSCVYLTDFGMSRENFKRAVTLAGDTYMLYIESNFLHRDIALAKASGHLTAYQAGIIAGRARVRHVQLAHFSQRYTKKENISEETFYSEMSRGRNKFNAR